MVEQNVVAILWYCVPGSAGKRQNAFINDNKFTNSKLV